VRLTLLLILGFLAIAGGGFYFLLREIHDDVERQYAQAAEEPMVDMAHLFASMLEVDLKEGRIDPSHLAQSFDRAYQRRFRARIYHLEKSRLFTHIYVTGPDGVVMFDSDEGRREGEDFSGWRDVQRTLEGHYGARSTRIDPDDSLSSVFHVAAPIHWRDEIVGVVSVSRPESAMAMFVTETRRIILTSGVITGLVVIGLGSIYAYWLLRPISHLTRYAQAVEHGERAARPRRLGRGELRRLGKALQRMREALEGRRYVQNYVQTLTHELKSPLAAIRGAAELLDEDMPREKRSRFLANIRSETTRSEDLVRRLLQLAAVESRRSLEAPEEIDLVDLIRGEIERIQLLLEPKSLRIAFDPAETAGRMVQGDRFLLRTALHNLLTNAADFSPEHGVIEVACPVRDGNVEIRVTDHGPGIPAYAKPKVFDRFFSLKHTVSGRKGSGLGLCFVKEAVELHGGSVELLDREPSGTIVRIILPAG